MHDAISFAPEDRERRLTTGFGSLRSFVRALAPTRAELGFSILSATLLIAAFPDLGLWPLAWIGLMPLMLAIAKRPERGTRAFVLGWLFGTIFFYGSCYWLTYAMIRYGNVPTILAYVVLLPGAIIMGLFPAAFSLGLSRAVRRWGPIALFAAPFLWALSEWIRLAVTGQLWNALGYSQAFVVPLIQSASWGGVYLVGFLIVSVNGAVAFALIKRRGRALLFSVAAVAVVFFVIFAAEIQSYLRRSVDSSQPFAMAVAIQPNVPMDASLSLTDLQTLLANHIDASEKALGELDPTGIPRVVIWPESPMNFMYARDTQFRDIVTSFTTRNRTSLIFNSLEPAPADGSYNSAIIINENGRLTEQYDKIRLLPFGEYVPLPRWLPGVNLVPVMVGDFTPGSRYPLMPIGDVRSGVFICFESAFPSIARAFTREGADVLINISNDGYLGPTPVMKQHLANAVFRAVENQRPVLRVTNTGITAKIDERGEVYRPTSGYQTAVRTWGVHKADGTQSFYTKHGDLFVGLCALISLGVLVGSWRKTLDAKS